MIKRIVLLVFILLLFNNCGYSPIYSKKNQNFDINKINLSGESKINNLLLKKLKFYSDNPDSQKSFELMLNTSSDKTVVTKDKKGNPTQFSISVSIIMTLKDDFGNENTTIFSGSSAYANSDDKFDLAKYENNIIKNMTEKIFSDMILFIQNKV